MQLFNKAVVTILPMLPVSLVRKFANRYMAGESVQEAVNVVRMLMQQKCCATMTILGEHVTEKSKTTETVEEYVQLLETIAEEKLDSNISVKPTQVGLQIDFDLCQENLARICQVAKEHGNFVRLDMEDLQCTDPTIHIYEKLRKDFSNVGIVIQSYLRKSMRDIRNLLDSNFSLNTRLCKGIYVIPRKHAFKDPQIINDNYMALLSELLNNNAYVGIATHDEKLVYHASRLIDTMQIPRESYEFQMLLGVDAELRNLLTQAGHKVRVYVPFGKEWLAYSMRRMKENPNIAGYVMKNMFTGS